MKPNFQERPGELEWSRLGGGTPVASAAHAGHNERSCRRILLPTGLYEDLSIITFTTVEHQRLVRRRNNKVAPENLL